MSRELHHVVNDAISSAVNKLGVDGGCRSLRRTTRVPEAQRWMWKWRWSGKPAAATRTPRKAAPSRSNGPSVGD